MEALERSALQNVRPLPAPIHVNEPIKYTLHNLSKISTLVLASVITTD